MTQLYSRIIGMGTFIAIKISCIYFFLIPAQTERSLAQLLAGKRHGRLLSNLNHLQLQAHLDNCMGKEEPHGLNNV